MNSKEVDLDKMAILLEKMDKEMKLPLFDKTNDVFNSIGPLLIHISEKIKYYEDIPPNTYNVKKENSVIIDDPSIKVNNYKILKYKVAKYEEISDNLLYMLEEYKRINYNEIEVLDILSVTLDAKDNLENFYNSDFIETIRIKYKHKNGKTYKSYYVDNKLYDNKIKSITKKVKEVEYYIGKQKFLHFPKKPKDVIANLYKNEFFKGPKMKEFDLRSLIDMIIDENYHISNISNKNLKESKAIFEYWKDNFELSLEDVKKIKKLK